MAAGGRDASLLLTGPFGPVAASLLHLAIAPADEGAQRGSTNAEGNNHGNSLELQGRHDQRVQLRLGLPV
jgi:hypothetical protein